MCKKEYIEPQIEVILLNSDSLMDGVWWSVEVTDEEIEDEDIGAKRSNFTVEEWPRYNAFEE